MKLLEEDVEATVARGVAEQSPHYPPPPAGAKPLSTLRLTRMVTGQIRRLDETLARLAVAPQAITETTRIVWKYELLLLLRQLDSIGERTRAENIVAKKEG